VHAAHTRLAAARGVSAADVPHPSSWPFGGDAISIVSSSGGVLLPLVIAGGGGDALAPDVLHAFQRATGGDAPWDPACALFTPRAAAGADDTAVGDYGGAGAWTDLDLPNDAAARACNASCWASAACAAWDLIKVTPSSGKARPACGLFAAGAAAGCRSDPNQWAGAKVPLPFPPPGGGGVTQAWTLPLSWVGRSVRATQLTPAGEVTGGVNVTVDGRNLTIAGVTPGWAVRLEV